MSCLYVVFMFYRKDFPDETSQMSPSRPQHITWFIQSVWPQLSGFQEGKTRNNRDGRVLSRADLTVMDLLGRETTKWTRMERWTEKFDPLSGCCVFILAKLAADSLWRGELHGVHTYSGLRPQNCFSLCVLGFDFFWHWHWFQLLWINVADSWYTW